MMVTVLLWSSHAFSKGLPQKANGERGYLAARRAIAWVESNENPCAKNPLTSASGKYQFMKAWNPFFKKNYGRTWASVVPKCKAAASVKATMGLHQDAMFDVYYNLQVRPWIDEIRIAGLGKRFSDIELLAIYHRQGPYHGRKYLRYGSDWAHGKWGNKHISEHIRRVLKGVDRFDSAEMLIGFTVRRYSFENI
jgi:hypothetical protein